MSLTLTLGRFASAVIRLHLLLPAFFTWLFLNSNKDIPQSLQIYLLLAVMLALAVHEATHFLVAKLKKINLYDVTLYPFGARYSFREKYSVQISFFFYFLPITTNTLLAFLFLDFMGSPPSNSYSFILGNFALANALLAVINIFPCSPLDGGALLKVILESHGAKNIGKTLAVMSQACCFLFAIAAYFFSAPIAVALALFLLFTAIKDKMENKMLSNADNLTAQSVMIPLHSLKVFQHNLTLSRALQEASVSAQDIFPVFFGQQLVGFVTRSLLLEEAASDPEERYLTHIVIKESTFVPTVKPVKEIIAMFMQEELNLIIVEHENSPVGFILKEQLLNFLVVKAIQKDQRDFAEKNSDFMM